MTTQPNAIYRFNVIPIKLPMAFFTELEQKNFTIHMETQKTPNSQSSPEKEEWSWRNQPSWFQTILQSHSYQESMVRHKNKKYGSMKQDKKPKYKPRTYGHLIFDKGGKNIQWGKDSLFSKWCWETWTVACKSMKLEHTLTPFAKISSKWLKT